MLVSVMKSKFVICLLCFAPDATEQLNNESLAVPSVAIRQLRTAIRELSHFSNFCHVPLVRLRLDVVCYVIIN